MPVLSPERHSVSTNLERRYQLQEDVTTWLAEALDGEMHNAHDFDFDGCDLISEDGRAMLPILEKGLADAESVAALEPRFAEEVVRSRAEMAEYQSFLAMARREGPNTIITIWEIPQYVLDYGADVGGYRYHLRRAMARFAHRLPNGKLRIQSQSLDGGFRPGFESLYDMLGQDSPEDGPLYNQPIQQDLDKEAAYSLRTKLRDRYDLAMELNTGVRHHAGRTEEPVCDTMDFVRRQTDLTDCFIDLYEGLHMNDIPQDQLYDLAAALQLRMSGRRFVAPDASGEMGGAGAAARSTGQIFSACGDTISGSTKTAEEQLNSLGFGGILKVMTCGVCGGKAIGIVCGDAICNEKDCGSEIKNGQVIDRRREKQKELRRQKRQARSRKAVKNIWEYFLSGKI